MAKMCSCCRSFLLGGDDDEEEVCDFETHFPFLPEICKFDLNLFFPAEFAEFLILVCDCVCGDTGYGVRRTEKGEGRQEFVGGRMEDELTLHGMGGEGW